MSNGWWYGGFAFREKVIDNVLPTNHVLIVFRSMFSEHAAALGDSTKMFKLISSENKQIEQPLSFI